MSPQPTLHMICGKVAAGKSTLAAKLSLADQTVLIAEDEWLDVLFSDQMSSLPDYVRCAWKLRSVMGLHISALLNASVSVVLDFPANTVENRAWMRDVLDKTNAAHQLHLLDISDAQCLERLQQRNARGDHPFKVTEQQFHQLSEYYVPPTPAEGFNIVLHKAET